MTVENVIIIGSGPAGLTAALYTARADLKPLVFTGNEIGGQVSITNEVENYPGFPDGLTGPELVDKFQKQAERFGARVEYAEVTEVDFDAHPFRIRSYDNEYQAKAIIIATGASPSKLGVPGETGFTGRGVSYCATCDGFFFQGREIVVVGGGDSALEEAVFLTKFASRVRVIHRRDQLRAGSTLQERAKRNQKIEFIWNTVVTEINGNGAVESVQVKDVNTGEVSTLEAEGVFIYIGHYPNSQLFKGKLKMDEEGYLIADRRTCTSVPGVFAAGEIADPIFRQVITSAGEGCKAAIQVERYLAELEDRAYPGHQ
ncbi:MAG: thioredoxin-disulfide reductase [Anaerolineales bacterium]|nr:MAG: thioredoxin-disulfide reductase [Anaerolineales bacterium]